MPKYLVQASYTAEGTRGLLKGGGGTARKAAVQQLVQSLEGKLDTIYYGFGDDDVFVIMDLPDHISAAAIALSVRASGAVNLKTTVLLTPEEIDQAARKTVQYRPPGQ